MIGANRPASDEGLIRAGSPAALPPARGRLFLRFAAALPIDDPAAAREALNDVMGSGAAPIGAADRAFAAAFRAVPLTCAGYAVAAVTISGKLQTQQQGDDDG